VCRILLEERRGGLEKMDQGHRRELRLTRTGKDEQILNRIVQ
jgi:hypothetical protein